MGESLVLYNGGRQSISVKMAKKEMMTVAMATIPKSSGESSRARIPATTSEIMIPLYLAMAVLEYSRKKLLFNIVRHFVFSLIRYSR